MNVDWSPFFTGFWIILIIGVLSGVFAEPLNRIIERVEEKASGRTAPN